MPDDTDRLVKDVKDAETALTATLTSQNDLVTGAPPISIALNRLRGCVDQLALSDLVKARSHSAEGRLWNAHTVLRNAYKGQLKTLRTATSSRPVETRKLIKIYLEFLKDGQRWYRAFIGRLNQRYGGIPELRQLAGYAPGAPPTTDSDIARACLLSCYQSLICLGDLSRWRTADKLDREPTWGPAIGFYDLAITLRPESGFAFNQRCVIAQSERDLLRTTYYVYRSIVVPEPFKEGMNNLSVHIASMRRKWSTDLAPAAKTPGPEAASKMLTAWFLRLHCLCFAGEAAANHDEMEREVLTRFESIIMSAQSSKLLMKMILITIAAEHTALLRLEKADPNDSESIIQSFYLYHRLNLKTMSVLIDIWSKTVHSNSAAESDAFPSAAKLRAPKAQIPHITNVVLPLLRTYCLWLGGNYPATLVGGPDNSPSPEAVTMWPQLAQMLTATYKTYPVLDLPTVPYLLDEDVETVAFAPLDKPEIAFMWQGDDGLRKPKPTDQRIHRGPAAMETSGRIRDILMLGVWMSAQGNAPIDFDGEQFVHSGFDASRPGTSGSAQIQSSLRSQPRGTITPPPQRQQEGIDSASRVDFVTVATKPLSSPVRFRARSISPIDDQEELARSMVDDLVGPDDSPFPMRRNGSQLDVTTQREQSPSSFVPTPISVPPQRKHSGIFKDGGLMASPLMFGHNSVWSPAGNKGTTNQTPPNGQGG